jgi:putative FmdB family regulatory protein
MAIYEYACEKCESEFEMEQRITDDPIKTCPRCKSKKIKRLISRTSFVLKGGGWYSDLYSSSGAKDDKVATPDSSNDTTQSDAADSKSATPSEAKSADTPKAKDKVVDKGKAKRKSGKSAA